MKVLRIVTGIVLLIIALNAFGGGWYAMAGAESVPDEWLQGSPFATYFIPGLFLFVVIGGSTLFASIAFFRKWKGYYHTGIFSAILLSSWIVIQMMIVGYVSSLQPIVFVFAIFIGIVSVILKMKG